MTEVALRGMWLAQSVEHVPLDLGVVISKFHIERRVYLKKKVAMALSWTLNGWCGVGLWTELRCEVHLGDWTYN